MLGDARDREEHPEAATVDRLPLGLPGQPIERSGRDERDARLAAAIGARARLVDHEPELAADEIGKRVRERPLDEPSAAGLPKKSVSSGGSESDLALDRASVGKAQSGAMCRRDRRRQRPGRAGLRPCRWRADRLHRQMEPPVVPHARGLELDVVVKGEREPLHREENRQ